uniref:Phosphatidylinositol N-acetylglucosaminyltransferase subunit H conserved domain-containing protein n=1 Tax=Oryza nivara TaxID=4536 RepID=A0A0E0FGR7_ORYNI
MKNRAVEMSSGVYTYKHHCEGGFDIHEIYIKRSKFRVLFSYVGEIFLFANVLHALLLKESLCINSFWSISFAFAVAKCLKYKPVKKESLLIMPTFGVQLEQHFWSGRVHRQFVPVGKLLKPVLNEHVTPITCYWSLVLLLHSEDKLVRVFKKVYPPVKMMVPIWKALDAFTNYGGMGNSVALQPNPLLINVEQGLDLKI